MDYQAKSIALHRQTRGKILVESRVRVENREDLSLAYTPGVAGPCLAIAKDSKEVRALTATANSVAVISDGSAVLGLGNIGPRAALPVMEGKCVLFKRFAGLDAFPIVLSVHETEEIVAAVKAIAPTFGAINLEDIAAPRCFDIEARLIKELDTPVMHDDQHGTAIVILAGLINALKIVRKQKESVQVVINGAGAAGIAGAKLLYAYGFRNLVLCDSQGIVSNSRSDLNEHKKQMLETTNPHNVSGTLQDALVGADIFLGVSKANLLTRTDIATMAQDSIVFAMANPTPEIMPEEARAGGARVVGTGRSDLPNQINNVLAYPGVFKGALSAGAREITQAMKFAAAEALASATLTPTADKIFPDPFEPDIADRVAEAVAHAALKDTV